MLIASAFCCRRASFRFALHSLHSPAEAQGRRDKAIELLQRFGLANLADRPISELAGGVRKLIDIAMALVRRPKLLLLDEPTAGMSPEETFKTGEMITELNRKPIKSAEDAVAYTEKPASSQTLVKVWTKEGSHYLTVDESSQS